MCVKTNRIGHRLKCDDIVQSMLIMCIFRHLLFSPPIHHHILQLVLASLEKLSSQIEHAPMLVFPVDMHRSI